MSPMSRELPPEPDGRWDWLWTTLKVVAWLVIGLVALVMLLFGLCVVIIQFVGF